MAWQGGSTTTSQTGQSWDGPGRFGPGRFARAPCEQHRRATLPRCARRWTRRPGRCSRRTPGGPVRGATRSASTRSSPRTWPAARTGSSTRSTTSSSPTTPSGPPSCGAGTPASASRSRARTSTTAARATRSTAGTAEVSPEYAASRRPLADATYRLLTATAGRSPPARLLRAARVGDGAPALRGRHPAPGPPAAAGPGGHRRGGGVAPDHLHALRRVPVLHPERPPAQHALSPVRTTGRRTSSRAACTPTWTSTSTPSG